MIAYYKTQDRDFGYNLTAGGEGCLQLQRATGKNNPLSKPVYQYDLDGNFIRQWDNAGCVEKEIGILATDIGMVARGNLYVAGDYIWKYELLDNVKPYHLKQYRNIPICQIDKNFTLIATFDDVYKIDKNQFGSCYRPYNIIMCCTKERAEYGGCYWCFKDDYNEFKEYMVNRIHNRKAYARKSICMYDDSFHLVAQYESTTDAFEKTGIPKSTIKGYCGRGQAKHGFKNTGYYWYYADDMKEGDANG